MSSKLHHILLVGCYVLAWLLPLEHEHEVEKERAEHRLCIAEYDSCNDSASVVLHKKCQHHHHDDEHCTICQSGHSFRQGFVLSPKTFLPPSQATLGVISNKFIFLACQLFWHVVQPRAP